MPDGTEQEIRPFVEGQDAEYEECVRRGGYVLVERGPTDHMLHYHDCSHLQLTAGRFTLTKRPRRWAKRRQPLIEWVTEHTGAKPKLCRTCM
jgi:hypothetical protein